ncbi:MAG TPA: SRPBCC domain-containing protein [Enhygromyxa sp.]|nr:SRPBCC domain-containing protein [Enhygromyxa sp.]
MARVFVTRVEIDASVERVWSIIANLDGYRDWNPFTPRIETDFVVGHPIVLHVDFGRAKPRRQVEFLRRWAPGEELRWGMTIGPAWFFRAERVQRVEPLGPERCRYVSEDAFAGLFSPIVEALYGAKVQRGFDALGAALKRLAESAPGGA